MSVELPFTAECVHEVTSVSLDPLRKEWSPMSLGKWGRRRWTNHDLVGMELVSIKPPLTRQVDETRNGGAITLEPQFRQKWEKDVAGIDV